MPRFPSIPKGKQLGEVSKRPHPGIPIKKSVILELIKKYHGNLSRIADAIGTNRHTLKDRCNQDKDLDLALQNARERYIDELEGSVWERALESKDTTLQLFLLKTQGRNRGYDQDEAKNAAKDIATAAFDFIIKKKEEESKK